MSYIDDENQINFTTSQFYISSVFLVTLYNLLIRLFIHSINRTMRYDIYVTIKQLNVCNKNQYEH